MLIPAVAVRKKDDNDPVFRENSDQAGSITQCILCLCTLSSVRRNMDFALVDIHMNFLSKSLSNCSKPHSFCEEHLKNN